jgi:ArsR family metal-binding transcriptional regulator
MQALKTELFTAKCTVNSTDVHVRVVFDRDLSDLLPYLNATQKQAQYLPQVPHIKFKMEGHWVTVSGVEACAYSFEDEDAGREGGRELASLLGQVEASRDSIEPDETAFEPPSVLAILKELPNEAGCRECGHPSCMALAAAVARGEAVVEDCKLR